MIKNKEHIKIGVIILLAGLLFVPLLYSGIYLASIWDAYGQVDKVPVAFVNLDKSYTKNGKVYDLGDELVQNLKENNKVNWKFIDEKKAFKGVKGAEYYAVIEIPADFSKNIANLKSSNIVYISNKGKNFVFSQISAKIADNIKVEIANNIESELVSQLGSGIDEIKISLQYVSKGTGSLIEGNNKLLTGSQSLTTSLSQAADGSVKLGAGLGTLKEGEKSLTNGIIQISAGLKSFKNEFNQPGNEVSSMLQSLSALDSNTKILRDSSQVLTAGIDNKLSQSTDRLRQVSTNIRSSVESIESIDFSGLSIEDQDILRSALGKIKDNSTDLDITVATDLTAMSGTLKPMIEGLSSLKTATSKLVDGGNQLASSLILKQTRANIGLSSLLDGVVKIETGSDGLVTGISQAEASSDMLSQGLVQLNYGSVSLNNGIGSVGDGLKKLNDGLDQGIGELNDSLTVSNDDLGSFAKSPVGLSDESINVINHYGEGLAPYFIALSLWIGAMLINLFLSLAKNIKLLNNKFLNRFGMKFVSCFLCVVVQALILSFVLTRFLGLDPVSLSGFYLSTMLVSVVFFSFMYGISEALGIAGTAVIFVLLILQLASSGGTFPIETAPGFFGAIGHFLPMTYGVNVFRLVIGGINGVVLKNDVLLLFVFMAGSLILGGAIRFMFNHFKKFRKQNN